MEVTAGQKVSEDLKSSMVKFEECYSKLDAMDRIYDTTNDKLHAFEQFDKNL